MACIIDANLEAVSRRNTCPVAGSMKALYIKGFSSIKSVTATDYKKFMLNQDMGGTNEEIGGERNGGAFVTQTIDFMLKMSNDAVERANDIKNFDVLLKAPALDVVVEYYDGTQYRFGAYNGLVLTGGAKTSGQTRSEGWTQQLVLTGEEPSLSKLVTLV